MHFVCIKCRRDTNALVYHGDVDLACLTIIAWTVESRVRFKGTLAV